MDGATSVNHVSRSQRLMGSEAKDRLLGQPEIIRSILDIVRMTPGMESLELVVVHTEDSPKEEKLVFADKSAGQPFGVLISYNTSELADAERPVDNFGRKRTTGAPPELLRPLFTQLVDSGSRIIEQTAAEIGQRSGAVKFRLGSLPQSEQGVEYPRARGVTIIVGWGDWWIDYLKYWTR